MLSRVSRFVRGDLRCARRLRVTPKMPTFKEVHDNGIGFLQTKFVERRCESRRGSSDGRPNHEWSLVTLDFWEVHFIGINTHPPPPIFLGAVSLLNLCKVLNVNDLCVSLP
jgi:hypothetical protein